MKKSILFLGLILSLQLSAQENNPLTCADGLDNDGNNLIDCEDPACQSLSLNGCAKCFNDGLSFADIAIEYVPGCPLINPKNSDPVKALGAFDSLQYLSLGEGGFVKLGFTNNILTNSGDSLPDLWIFEVGGRIEASDLELKPVDNFTKTELQKMNIPDIDLDGYYEIGTVGGSISGFDIDGVLAGYVLGELKFDAVKIKDVKDDKCSPGSPGADISAICALQSTPIEKCFNNIDDDFDGLIDENCDFVNCEFNNGEETQVEIFGNVCVQGIINVSEAVQLTPSQTPPLSPKTGTMYFDAIFLKLRVWDGNQWQDCW